MTRRTKAELDELAAEARGLVAGGMTKTEACKQVGIGLATYNNLSGDSPAPTPKGETAEIAQLVDTLKKTKKRLEELGVEVPGGEIIIRTKY